MPVQRLMLERLTVLLSSHLGSHIGVAVSTLGAMGLLLELLGEIDADELASLDSAVGEKLIHPSSVIRRQVMRHFH